MEETKISLSRKTTATLTILFITAIFFANINAVTAEQPRIYLDPSTITLPETTNIGYLFNVTVICENVPELGGAQIYMEFNDSIINATRWWYVPEAEGGFMPEPVTALPTPPNPSYYHLGPGKGRIQIAVCKGDLPPQAPWGHAGKIAIIEFNVTAVPTDGALTTALSINNIDTYLLDPDSNEIPEVVKEDGSYTLIPEFIPLMALTALAIITMLTVLIKKKKLI